MTYITNATITKTRLCIERGFILTAWIHLEFDCGGQAYGGRALHLSKESPHHDKALKYNAAGDFILNTLLIAGVDSWEDLPGRNIRIEKKSEFGEILAIGHIVKDAWYRFQVPEETKDATQV